MARNIEIGVKKTVVAKLLERGMSEAEAAALADAHAAATLAAFNDALSLAGGVSEDSYDRAFEAVKTLAQTL